MTKPLLLFRESINRSYLGNQMPDCKEQIVSFFFFFFFLKKDNYIMKSNLNIAKKMTHFSWWSRHTYMTFKQIMEYGLESTCIAIPNVHYHTLQVHLYVKAYVKTFVWPNCFTCSLHNKQRKQYGGKQLKYNIFSISFYESRRPLHKILNITPSLVWVSRP